ncbi:unnamed protein product [Gulo gulo]|uniref:Uncharacterized protein n=1 Tax=Gulo gulo TaxID=48420 RepID=A0A9X9LFF1_GULGU|nr:unnamed protein product [Gulo gulo]
MDLQAGFSCIFPGPVRRPMPCGERVQKDFSLLLGRAELFPTRKSLESEPVSYEAASRKGIRKTAPKGFKQRDGNSFRITIFHQV